MSHYCRLVTDGPTWRTARWSWSRRTCCCSTSSRGWPSKSCPAQNSTLLISELTYAFQKVRNHFVMPSCNIKFMHLFAFFGRDTLLTSTKVSFSKIHSTTIINGMSKRPLKKGKLKKLVHFTKESICICFWRGPSFLESSRQKLLRKLKQGELLITCQMVKLFS